ncbi:hypothetical protein DAPPUDRAFT_309181 [Daphnia pulex]|uniref:Uncharacterized protein n=1 Tax=Daphnia pulex TaxID=6669 RepID=E9HAM5_DAPPU|nr:hypothetical protein DAPPUDRAFT_309181 [Daphnia pulex]|eukprot:EFX71208.1 hypothetical protein DAPPUDRAFT_309181 [Daphnia pulex]
MNRSLFQVLFPIFLVIIPSLSQISFGTLGRGLNSGYLQNGGLIYPNGDGSGPQASSLAAAIYGVAVPPGFSQFSASENFFGDNKGDLFSDSFGGSGISDGIKPADLLLGTGIHTGGNGGGQRGSYSTYISDFSAFGDFGHHANNDQKPSSSSLVEIDPIAARFGVVIPNVPFDPSLSGSTETFSGSTSTGADDGRKDLFNISPVETSIKFDLPTRTSLSDVVQFPPQFSTNINNLSVAFASQNGLPRIDESFSVNTASNSPSSSDVGKNQVDVITTAFKFADDQIIKTEEIKRNFEHATAAHTSTASGKYTASTSSTEIDPTKNFEKGTENVRTVSIKEKIDQPKAKIPPKQKETTKTSNEFIVSQIKSTSPYVYRGSQRGQQEAQESERDTIITEAPENLPEFQYLKAAENDGESYTARPKEPVATYNSYGFLTSPGYRTYHN